MSDFTQEQVAAYKADQSKCPCCRSTDICFTWDNSDTWECEDCCAQWRKVYTLTDITMTRKPEKEITND